jgi:ribose transport system ATP-binding protein
MATEGTEGALLSITNLSVEFAGRRALNEVSVAFRLGEIHALLGPNGAGKSTLIKVLAGIVAPRPGAQITVGQSSPVAAITPAQATRLGLRFVHQDLGLVAQQSVLENLFIANRYPVGWYGLRRRAAAKLATTMLERVGLSCAPSVAVATLSPSQRVLLATARALSSLPATGAYLFVDEPTASLDELEADTLLSQLQAIASGGNVGICLVTHRLRDAVKFANRATVLHDGRVRLEASPGTITEPTLLEALGARASTRRPRSAGSLDRPPVLSLRQVAHGRLLNISLSIARGEILGATGLEGCGARDLVQVAYGIRRPKSGQIVIDGHPAALRSPHDAVRLGIGLVPSDRVTEGGIPDLSAGENYLVPRYAAFSTGLWYRRRAAYQDSLHGLSRYGVSPSDPRRRFAAFSGGNQQKIVLGRWLSTSLRILILHEPTAGVDVASRALIYDQIRRAADSGLGVLLVSSDLVEIADLSERAIVLVNGRIAATLEASDITEDNLLAWSFTDQFVPEEASHD